jgi:hypothetical protein
MSLNSSEKLLLEWLLKDDGQYGECHGATLDSLIAKRFVKVGGEETWFDNGFIAKGTNIMFSAVSITDEGRAAIAAPLPTTQGDGE